MSDIKDFWAKAHRNNGKGPLTGSKYGDIMKFFNLEGKIKKHMNVLNIGVGLGGDTIELSRQCNAYALDICQEAIDRVKKHIIAGYLHENIDELPDNHFDLAYSYLVAGHMPEKELLIQFKNVIRALKPGGKFYIQLGECTKGGNNIKENTVNYQNNPDVPPAVQFNSRTVEYAKALVEQCGGKVSFVSKKKHWKHVPHSWYYFIIQKK